MTDIVKIIDSTRLGLALALVIGIILIVSPYGAMIFSSLPGGQQYASYLEILNPSIYGSLANFSIHIGLLVVGISLMLNITFMYVKYVI